jgi:hypothetical protein
VRRSKCLPEGGNWTDENAAEILDDLEKAIDLARAFGDYELKRDEQAREIWRNVYPELSEGKPGMAGALTARAEAQVMRLATLYALTDVAFEIKAEHLLAALALWQYCEASVQYIFGSALGDPTCDTILSALEDSGKLNRTQIRDLLGRHAPRDEIDRALGVLRDLGRVEVSSKKTGGRPVELWRLKEAG